MESPDYLKALRAALPDQTDVELELLAAHSPQLCRLTKKTRGAHRRRAMEMLWPNRVWHEWREQRVQSVQECLETKTKELMWIGSSNSNKSADMADIALTMWWSKPELTSIYVTSPYESATELGLWAYIIEQFESAQALHPKLPGKIRFSDSSIILYDRNPRSFIRVATVDQIGKLVGKKSRDFNEGNLIVLADELPAFSQMAGRNFLKTMPNLWSVPNMLLIGAGNFAETTDALGIACDPNEDDIPNGYEGFNADVHFRWRTKRRGLVLRFDGLQSPNVKAGKDIYPFVTTLDYIEQLAGQPGGLQSPDAMRFVRSAPITSLNEFTITNAERIRAGGAYDPMEWRGGERMRVAFTDPGFGGDPCVLQKIEFGWQALPSGEKREVLSLLGPPHIIPIVIGKLDAEGKVIPVEDQVVDGSREHCREWNIPPNHFGYDGSMRANIGAKFASRWSAQTIPLDTQGPATDRKVSAGNPKPWKEQVDRFISELWFAIAGIIDSYQLKNLQLSPKAAAQLSSRKWNWQGKRKKSICTKQEYKEDMRRAGKNPESPGEADALVGAVEIARRLGFTATSGNAKGSLDLILSMMRDTNLRSTIQALQNSRTLKPGQLNAIHSPKSSNKPGRLNIHANR